MPKRSIDDVDVNDLAETINMDEGLIPGLLQFDRDELAVLIAHVANEAGVTTAAFKKARTDLPFFAAKQWSDVAPQFGRRQNIELLELETFTTAKFRLPPSLHEAMFENAWCWQDVYREKVDWLIREEARVRILEPYIVPILALFQGRIIDKPGHAMMETRYSSGGEVEHGIFMINGVLFLIVYCKFSTLDANALAQLFLELLSAAETNKSNDFEGLRVYGLLTNLTVFKFYSYDPSTTQFHFDETMIVDNKRTSASTGMMNVSNKIFGIVLSAYVDGLRAGVAKRKNSAKRNIRQQTGRNTPTSSLNEGKNAGGRELTDQWEAALTLAESCVEKFKEPVASHQDIEDKANEALAFLTRSVRSIPRASEFTGEDDDPSTPAMLKALATRVTKETHERYLSKLKQ